MSAKDILDEFTADGWTDYAKIALLCEYIDNQQDNDALREFLARVSADEHEVKA